MGTFYVSSLVANSTVGTENNFSDPYGIEAVLTTSNPAGLAADDVVVLITDGEYSTSSTSMGSGVSGGYGDQGILVRSGDTIDGSPTTTRAVVNFAGQASGFYGFYQNHDNWVWAFIEVKNAYLHGWGIGTSGDSCTWIGCYSHDNGANGFGSTLGGGGGSTFLYCNASGNGGYGFMLGSGTFIGHSTMYRCVASNNSSGDVQGGYVNFQEGAMNVLGCRLLSTTGVSHNKTRAQLADTVHSNAGGTARTLYASGSTANAIMINSISDVALFTDHAASTDIMLVGGNVYTGTLDTDTSIVADYGNDTTTNPLLDSDQIPGADLSAAPLFDAVHTESAWIIPGYKEAGGGGGGGLLVHPGMSGGLRG